MWSTIDKMKAKKLELEAQLAVTLLVVAKAHVHATREKTALEARVAEVEKLAVEVWVATEAATREKE